MKYSIKDWGKGLNLDAMPSELEDGFCSGGGNVVFRMGFAERAPGVASAASLSFSPVRVALYQAAGSTTGVWAIVRGSTDLSASNLNGTEINIARYTEGAEIASITAVGTTATVTTVTNHGRTTGDLISLWGATPSAYNTDSASITVTGLKTFTYTTGSAPGGAATAVGLYAYNGAVQQFNNTGNVSEGVLNGVFVVNHSEHGAYYWNGSSSLHVRKIPNAPVARVVRPFKNYLIFLQPTVSGTRAPYRVLWSSAAEPGSIPTAFTATATNDSGSVDLAQTGGELLECLPLGDVNIIYKQDSRYSMQYVGGNDVFRFQRLDGTDGILKKDCVVNTPKGHVFLSQNYRVLIHNGGPCEHLSRGRVQQYINDNADPLRAHLAINSSKSEVWVFVSTSKALIWNWIDDTWGIKTFSADTVRNGDCGVLGSLYSDTRERMVFAMETGQKIGIVGEAADDLGTSFDSYIERTGMGLGDSDVVKNLQRSRWNFDGTAGATFNVQHGSSMTADGTTSYKSAVTYTLGTTDYADSRATGGRFVAVKVTWTSSSTTSPGRVRSCDLDVTAGGKR